MSANAVAASGPVVEVQRDGAVGVVTFNRPAVLNAFNRDMSDALRAAIAELCGDQAIKAIVLTGAGNHFMAGADIAMLRELARRKDAAAAKAYLLELFNPSLLERAPVPIIGAVKGYAFGMGCEIALGCDMRIGGKSTQLGQPEIRLGVMPGGGGSIRLQRLVGRGVAMELVLTGRPMKSDEAFSRGLLNAVVADEEVLPAALKLARDITVHGGVAIRSAKKAIWETDGNASQRALGNELELFSQLFRTDDAFEGLGAFLEKRRPAFTDR